MTENKFEAALSEINRVPVEQYEAAQIERLPVLLEALEIAASVEGLPAPRVVGKDTREHLLDQLHQLALEALGLPPAADLSDFMLACKLRKQGAEELADCEVKLRCARNAPSPEVGIGGCPYCADAREQEAASREMARGYLISLEHQEKELTQLREQLAAEKAAWAEFNGKRSTQLVRELREHVRTLEKELADLCELTISDRAHLWEAVARTQREWAERGQSIYEFQRIIRELKAQLAAAPDLNALANEWVKRAAGMSKWSKPPEVLHACAQELRALAQIRASQLAPFVQEADRSSVWIVYDPECGFEEFDSQEEAQAAAQECLDDYRDDARDGWNEAVTQLRWGRFEVYQAATETHREPAEPGRRDFDEYAEYALAPPLAQILARQPKSQAIDLDQWAADLKACWRAQAGVEYSTYSQAVNDCEGSLDRALDVLRSLQPKAVAVVAESHWRVIEEQLRWAASECFDDKWSRGGGPPHVPARVENALAAFRAAQPKVPVLAFVSPEYADAVEAATGERPVAGVTTLVEVDRGALCPMCGLTTDNGHDRCDPPNAYLCSDCAPTDDSAQLVAQPKAVDLGPAVKAIAKLLDRHSARALHDCHHAGDTDMVEMQANGLEQLGLIELDDPSDGDACWQPTELGHAVLEALDLNSKGGV